MPDVRKSSDGRWAVRDSPDGQWMIMPTPPPGFDDGQNPASNRPLDSNGIKQVMTFLGATAAPLVAPEGVLPALAAATMGGAGGRVLGGAASAPTSKNGGNLGEDLVTGGLEGFTQEALPAGLGLLGRGAGMATDLLPPRLKGWTVPAIVDKVEGALSNTPVKTTSQWVKEGAAALKNGLSGLKEAIFPAEKPNSVLSGMELSPEGVARNVAATNLRDVEGFSHAQAGKLEGIPGSGQSREIPYKAGRIPKKYSNPFPNLDPVKSPEPAEEVGRSVLSPTSLGGLKSAANSDLMKSYLDSLEGGIGSGKQSFVQDGVQYAPNEMGSHVAVQAPAGQGFDDLDEIERQNRLHDLLQAIKR